MKKLLLSVVLTFTTLSGFAQIVYEKGYFITESNNKTECLIKNIDWKNNPTAFEYKTSESGDPMTETLKNVKEFGVVDKVKFIKATVDIDKSSVNTSDLSRDKNPVYSRETQFLRVLVEGDYNLYEFADGNSKKYFYAKANQEIKPLVYKRYMSNTNVIQSLTNNMFKQQLLNDLKCPNTTIKDIERLDYDKAELQQFFVNYNNCNNTPSTYIEQKPDRNKFDVTIRPRINNSTLTFSDQRTAVYDSDFKGQIDFGVGLELEFFLPYNKNKWSVFLEPTYHTYKATERTGRTMDYTAKVTYNSIELPVGLRHYFYLNNTSKIFINAAYVFNFDNDAKYELIRDDLRVNDVLEINPSGNIALGAGYKYEKFSAEFRFQSRALLNDYYVFDTKFTQLSFILGYTIF